MTPPCLVVVISGKRKSGKDFLTDQLVTRLGADVVDVVHLSAPLKEQYAKDHNLDFAELLSASAYKEQHRAAMIVWGESKRDRDAGFFARLAVEGASKRVWIVSDARRPSDVAFFAGQFPGEVFTVRVEASLAARAARGWVFTPGIDDQLSECALDLDSGLRHWDLVVHNDGIAEAMEAAIASIAGLAAKKMASN